MVHKLPRRILLIASIAVLILILAACAGTPATSDAAPADAAAPAADAAAPADNANRTVTTPDGEARYPKITIGLDTDPQDLLPSNYNLGAKPYIYPNIYETLFDLENNEYVPVLAKGYTVVDDLHYQVELYDYIYDWAGNHITADDVVFATNWLIDTGFAFRYGIFESVEKVDDYNLMYTWTKPVTGVGELEFPWTRTIIFDQEAFESGNFATEPVGTGHYTVSEFVAGSTTVLEANDNYWQTDASLIAPRHAAQVQTIEYDIVAESSQHVIGLQTGTIDFSEKVPLENVADFQDGGEYAAEYDVVTTAGSLLYMLTPNQSEGNIGSDVNFRKAVYYAIDNAAAATATRTTAPALALGTRHFNDYVEAWESEANYITTFDPELAKEYLAKSAYDGETLSLMGYNDETSTTLLTIIQAFLTNVGINVELQVVEPNVINTSWTDPEAWDLVLYTIGGGSQVGEWNRILNNAELGTGMSVGFVADETLQELYTIAATNDTHNDETMTAVHNHVVEQGYHYPVVTPVLNLIHTSDIADLVLRENEFFLPGASSYYLD